MHNHDHHHHSHAVDAKMLAGTAFKIGIALNVVFIVGEIIAGLKYNSMALLTDAGHNISDVGSLAISLLAFVLARKKATAIFTYGYKKTTVLAALLNAVLLLIAVGVIAYESILRLYNPQPVEGTVVAWIAGLGIIINGITAFLFFRNKEKDLNIKSAYLHFLADALVSLGVVIAGIIVAYTGWNWIDAAMGLVIAVVIVISTWKLLIESFRLSVDAVPHGVSVKDIKDLILANERISEVHHIHIWSLSTTENALTAHIHINDELSFEQKMLVVKDLRHELMHHNIQHSTIELESQQNDCRNKEC
jgi:cobalt-zinc-cadmium efflux system protein